jgi:hypothetical protein
MKKVFVLNQTIVSVGSIKFGVVGVFNKFCEAMDYLVDEYGVFPGERYPVVTDDGEEYDIYFSIEEVDYFS